jgi:hypothetical protein
MQPDVRNAVVDSKTSCSIVRPQAVEGVTRDDFPLTHRLQLADTLNVSR